MRDLPLEKKPEYYKSIANNPQIENLDGGSIVGFTNLPIVGNIKATHEVTGVDINFYRFNHDLGKRYEPFVRVKYESEDYWQTLPNFEAATDGPPWEISVQDIGENYIDLLFYTYKWGKYEVEVYFIDFAI